MKTDTPSRLESIPKTIRVRSLRTGKIVAAKSSAAQIQRSVGVRPADVALATKALKSASSATKAATTAPTKAGRKAARKSPAKKR
jgi:hypothetical protein